MLYPPGSLGWQCHPQGYVRSSGSTLGPGGGCGAGGVGGGCPGCGFLWGEVVLSFETGGDSLAPPISLQAPGLCTLGLL